MFGKKISTFVLFPGLTVLLLMLTCLSFESTQWVPGFDRYTIRLKPGIATMFGSMPSLTMTVGPLRSGLLSFYTQCQVYP